MSEGGRVPCPMSGGGRGLFSEVQCIMGNGHMEPHPPEQNDKQIPVKTLLRSRAVNITYYA